nr:hypothetical protein CFP56_79063 [Quercus suber]
MPRFFSTRKMNNKEGQASLSREEEPLTQQNQTKKLFEPVHEPTGEPIEAERYRQGGDTHSMSNGWSNTNLTNHASPKFSLPLSPTINGILSCPKGIDTELNVGNDDNSPIITPINSNSQQSQWQVFNMVNIPGKEKSTTTTMKGNEPDQSNQPPHRAIWKPPPWSILKVNFDDAIFREQNSVDVVLDMGGGLVLFWRSTIDVIVEGSGINYIDTMFQEEDKAGIGVIIREC